MTDNLLASADRSELLVCTYDPAFKPQFIALNRLWIETHFVLEPMDVIQLETLEKSILDVGGEIFFVLLEGKAVGTCAMLPHGPGTYELAKMAVDPECRGRGIGGLLMNTVIEWARERHAEKILLLSNTALAPALRLYERFGFRTTHLGHHPEYNRANISMELEL